MALRVASSAPWAGLFEDFKPHFICCIDTHGIILLYFLYVPTQRGSHEKRRQGGNVVTHDIDIVRVHIPNRHLNRKQSARQSLPKPCMCMRHSNQVD